MKELVTFQFFEAMKDMYIMSWSVEVNLIVL